MGKMAIGYGSEWHLMRFMARHRNCLEKIIEKAEGIEEGTGAFEWIDFEFNNFFLCDAEIKGLSFLEKFGITKPEGYINGWEGSQSWDAVFRLDGTIYLVEAKAHIDELSGDGCQASNGSREEIKDFITDNFKKYGITANDKCLGKYYQLANRLATAAFLSKNGISSKCLYIYFTNGYNKDYDTKSASTEDFRIAIDKEKKELNLNQDIIDTLYTEIFIEATSGKNDDSSHK